MIETIELQRVVVEGVTKGPHLLITGGVHGDEFESIAAIRRRSGFGAILPAATLPVYQSDLAARAGSPPGGSD